MIGDSPNSVALVIPAGQWESQAVDLGLATGHRIEFPDDDWTAAVLTFRVSYNGDDFDDLFMDSAEYVLSTAAAGRAVVLNQEAFFGVRRLIARSGTAAAPVVQVAQRALRLVKAPR
jgi:hypothetical protein